MGISLATNRYNSSPQKNAATLNAGSRLEQELNIVINCEARISEFIMWPQTALAGTSVG
jgi:hypothetical protein